MNLSPHQPRNTAFPAMVLPRLASGIPTNIVPRKLAKADASIAQFLYEAGAVQERDIPEQWDSVLEVCQSALDAWVKRELGPLHCLNPSFFLSANGNFDPHQRQNAIDTGKSPLHYHSVEIGWYESRARQWVIGAKMEAMEAHCAGLGQLVLRILQRQSCPVYPVFTAEHACYQASVQYWWGEEDEKAVLDMECSTDEERAAMQADMVTKQELIEAFPAWAIKLSHGDKLPQAELRKLLETVTDPEFRAIATDALALSKLKLKTLKQYEPELACEFVGWGAVLSWREDDVTIRVFDDMYNWAMEGESCDRIGELEIALDAPQTMRTWQESMREQFKAIRLIDRLIYQLAERY